MNATAFAPTTVAQVQDAVRSAPRLLPHGAGTKPGLTAVSGATMLDLRGMTGIVEYDPGEYTFTALAGTPLQEIASALATHGQAMPFDPPFVAAGATLGGAIAAGLSASGRYRYGGLRDFIVGVHIVDGTGRLVRGGGKVVKNAAGFDLPKLIVGSAGRLGVIVNASFKIFPAPLAWAGLAADFPTLHAAITALQRLMAGPYDLEALDILPDDAGGARIVVLIGGSDAALATRWARLRDVVGHGQQLDDDAIQAYRTQMREFTWLTAQDALVKVPTTLARLPALDSALASVGATRRYTVGGNLAWVGGALAYSQVAAVLDRLDLSGLVIRHAAGASAPSTPFIGRSIASPFLNRVRSALDPQARFIALP